MSTPLSQKLKSLIRKPSQFFKSAIHHSSSSSSGSKPSPSPKPEPEPEVKSTPQPRSQPRPQPRLHPSFTEHLTSHTTYTIEEPIRTHSCTNPTCSNKLTISQVSTTTAVPTPISITLSQLLPSLWDRGNEKDARMTISTTVPLQDTPFVREVNMYDEMLSDVEQHGEIAGIYDERGREVLVEDGEKEICCVACGEIWVFVLKGVKNGDGMRVILDC